MGKNLIIAFLLIIVFTQLAFGLKVPDVDLVGVTPEIKEIIEDYILSILNKGLYQLKINTSVVTSTTGLPTAVLQGDFAAVTKYLVIQVGNVNYRVALSIIP